MDIVWQLFCLVRVVQVKNNIGVNSSGDLDMKCSGLIEHHLKGGIKGFDDGWESNKEKEKTL